MAENYNVDTPKKNSWIKLTGADTQNVSSFDLEANTYNTIEAKLTVLDPITAKQAILRIVAPIQRGASGAAVVGSVQTLQAINGSAALLGATATIVASGNAAIVQVTGIEGLNLVFFCELSVDSVTQTGV